jgi:CheY-like chemotaxis protein
MKKILLIDDEVSIRELLIDFLTQIGYHVHSAKDGREGLRLLESDRDFDAILTDIEMPEVNGIDVVRHIKASEKHQLPVLAITGMCDSHCQRNLFDFVIEKPFDLKKLQTALHTLIK